MTRLNYFEAFQSKAAWHEDQLTRAFLVLIRFVPLVHARFLALIREEQERVRCDELVSPVTLVAEKNVLIETQVAWIRHDQGRLLSVLMSDEQWTKEHRVQSSERDARYDGVLAYTDSEGPSSRSEPDWLILVENKPKERNVWPDQINPSYHSLPRDHRLEIEPKPIALSWYSVIRDLRGLLDRDLTGRAEKMLVEDFLDYVADHYSYLLPFDTIGECRADDFLLQKRCDKILQDCATRASYTVAEAPIKGGRLEVSVPGIRYLWLEPKKDVGGHQYIELSLYPGDTVTQARDFLGRVNADKVSSLTEQNWRVWPNLHFAYMRTNLHWGDVSLGIKEYLEFWRRNQDRIRQEPRDQDKGFLPLFEDLRMEGLLGEHEIPELQKKTTETTRAVINVCPGIKLAYRWPLDKAAELDRRGELEKQVYERASEALVTFEGNL